MDFRNHAQNLKTQYTHYFLTLKIFRKLEIEIAKMPMPKLQSAHTQNVLYLFEIKQKNEGKYISKNSSCQ